MVGTPQLFPSAPYLSDKARFPKGFTPQRLRAVQETTGLNPQWHGGDDALEVANVRDNLARSTAPVDHMKNLDWMTDVRHLGSDASKGRYDPPVPNAAIQTGRIQLSPGEGRTLTPIHELGHHVSQIARTSHSAYEDTVDMGREEAYAENYAETHFRDRRGRAPQMVNASPEDWTAGGQRGGRHGGFHEGWSETRAAGSPIFLRHMERRAQSRGRQQRIDEQQTLW